MTIQAATEKTSPSLPTGEELAPTGVPLPQEDIHSIEGTHGHAVLTSGRKILLAFDVGTEDSDLAYEWVKRECLEGDHIFLCSVLPPSLYDPTLDYAGFGMGMIGYSESEHSIKVMRDLRIKTTATLREKGKELAAKGMQFTVHVIHGDARYSIIKVADYHGVDLIVLGRRHVTGFQRFISGASVSSYVVQHAPRSVLVVKN